MRLLQVPVIAIAGSGGGFRAMVGFSGVMKALFESGVLDCATYVAGLSGSTWSVFVSLLLLCLFRPTLPRPRSSLYRHLSLYYSLNYSRRREMSWLSFSSLAAILQPKKEYIYGFSHSINKSVCVISYLQRRYLEIMAGGLKQQTACMVILSLCTCHCNISLPLIFLATVLWQTFLPSSAGMKLS